ncbi:MAG TPA: FAD:protein FMN transferase [Polyangiaceae bacterium]|jgi:thiamine biosynthesis lipoprotein|nr:FAD:protein FMN transferase [Polyangiaceae bacterium]
MRRSRTAWPNLPATIAALSVGLAFACQKEEGARAEPSAHAGTTPTLPPASVSSGVAPPFTPVKVDFEQPAMGTAVHFIAYTTPALGERAIRDAMGRAHAEIKRLEGVMTSWRDDSEVGQINVHAGRPVQVGDETLEVIQKSLWSSKLSGGVFDISFHALGDLWKFGDAAEANPKLPDPKVLAEKRKLVDYRKIKVDTAAHTVTIGKGMRIDLGGIAKGYAVDKAAKVLEAAGLHDFLAQAGGDLYGAGSKPDGSPWVSGIQDPRGPEGEFFATIELSNHAFSTAGDYARAFFIGGKRYHHIIDPRTGYPATACRSVTVWAADAFTADAIDDAIFILGPEKGLPIIEKLPDAGAVIVDKNNKVWVSNRLTDKVHVLRAPTNGE